MNSSNYHRSTTLTEEICDCSMFPLGPARCVRWLQNDCLLRTSAQQVSLCRGGTWWCVKDCMISCP